MSLGLRQLLQSIVSGLRRLFAFSWGFIDRRRLLDSLAARVIYTFLGMSVFLFVGLGLTSWYVFDTIQSETAQRVRWSLAKAIALEIQPFYQEKVDERAASRAVYDFLLENPTVDVYILNQQGVPLTRFGLHYYGNQYAQVDLEPIQRFLHRSQSPKIPLYNRDPAHPEERVVFSVSELSIRGVPHYLYVVLVNRHERAYFARQLDSIAVSTGILVGMLIAILGVLGSEMIVRRTFRRFDGIMSAVSEFERGELSARAPGRGRDELGKLGRAVNSMAMRLDSHIVELRQKDLLRRELLADIWHDIKTPIAAVTALVETMRRETLRSPEELDRLAEQSLANISLLTRFLNDVRELAKLESGEITPSLVPCSIVTAAEDLSLAYDHLARERGIELILVAPPDLPNVLADLTMIERVMSNLLENGLRHTPQGGTVTLELSQVEQGISVSVVDTGHGIRVEDLPRVFERSYQAHGGGSTHSGSSGLGLTIVRRIIEQHGSSISVESTERVGTAFSFVLPLASAS